MPNNAQIAVKAWRYQITEPFSYFSKSLTGIIYSNDWVHIEDNIITVAKYYAWDGCSPAYYLPIFGWVGVPDGATGSDGVPEAYYASLVHDALCQFRGEIPIRKDDSLTIFKRMLIEGGFGRARAELYVAAVRVAGPQKWLGDKLPKAVSSNVK